MNTQKKILSMLGTIFAVVCILFFYTGCDGELSKAANSGINNGVNNAADQSEKGFEYTFYNNSSHTVYVMPTNEDELVLYTGEISSYTFNKKVRISQAQYRPGNLVSVRQSAFDIYFEDR